MEAYQSKIDIVAYKTYMSSADDEIKDVVRTAVQAYLFDNATGRQLTMLEDLKLIVDKNAA